MTPRTLPRPSVPFPAIQPYRLAVGTELHRIHKSELRAAQFNPGLGAPTRFAPFTDAAGAMVPSLYGGMTRESAAFESIFHDIEPSAAFKTVRLDTVTSRSVSRVSVARDLRLAPLFAPDLKAWSIARTDLIETPKNTYDQTVLWAQAIHAADPTIEGLIWTSRQCDPICCVALFGDRVRESDLPMVESLEVATNADLLLELRTFGARAGITLVS